MVSKQALWVDLTQSPPHTRLTMVVRALRCDLGPCPRLERRPLLSLLIARFGMARIAGEPQWAICGESFPVGCRFDHRIAGSQFFSANPDRRSRQYSTPTGAYRPGAALSAPPPGFPLWLFCIYLTILHIQRSKGSHRNSFSGPADCKNRLC